MKKFMHTYILIVCSLLFLTACASTENGEGRSDGNETIYFLTKVLGNQYWSVVEEGANAAAKELGVDLVVTGLANEAEVEKQVQQLQDAVSVGASGIVVGPTDSTAMANPVSEAFQSGIPIVIVDTMINTDDYSVALMTDNVEAGREAAETMLELLKNRGISESEEMKVGVQIGASGSQTIIDRLSGFNEYWDLHAPDTWQVLNEDIKVNDGDITKAVGFTQDMLTAYPTLKAVFGPNNGSTVGFVTGLMEANRTDITLVGFDFSSEIEDMIRTEAYDVATILQKQYLMGYEGVKQAVELARGIEPDQKVVDTGTMVITKDNIDDPEIADIINP